MKWGHWKVQDKFSFSLHCTWQITLGGVTFTQQLSSTPLSQTQLNKNAPRISLISDLPTATVPSLAFPPHKPPLVRLSMTHFNQTWHSSQSPAYPSEARKTHEVGPSQLKMWCYPNIHYHYTLSTNTSDLWEREMFYFKIIQLDFRVRFLSPPGLLKTQELMWVGAKTKNSRTHNLALAV